MTDLRIELACRWGLLTHCRLGRCCLEKMAEEGASPGKGRQRRRRRGRAHSGERPPLGEAGVPARRGSPAKGASLGEGESMSHRRPCLVATAASLHSRYFGEEKGYGRVGVRMVVRVKGTGGGFARAIFNLG